MLLSHGLSQEEKLLEKAQQAPYKEYIRIHQCDLLSDEQQHAEWIKGLDADFVVAADGAASLSRRAFPDAFVYCVAEGANRDAQQIRLGETASEFDEADYALGIALKPETTPPQKQALNVVLTLAQNVYLLNSQEGSRGFLNIRVTKEEYDAIFLATGNRGCTFGSPIRLFKEEDLYLITDARSRVLGLSCMVFLFLNIWICRLTLARPMCLSHSQSVPRSWIREDFSDSPGWPTEWDQGAVALAKAKDWGGTQTVWHAAWPHAVYHWFSVPGT